MPFFLRMVNTVGGGWGDNWTINPKGGGWGAIHVHSRGEGGVPFLSTRQGEGGVPLIRV